MRSILLLHHISKASYLLPFLSPYGPELEKNFNIEFHAPNWWPYELVYGSNEVVAYVLLENNFITFRTKEHSRHQHKIYCVWS